MKTFIRLSALFLASAMFFSGCSTQRPPQPEPLSLPKPETTTSLIEATAKLAETHVTRLHPNYVWAKLKEQDQDPEINSAFERALAQDTREAKLALLRVLELKFIHDPKTSGLDILGPELSHHFRDFDWQEAD